MNTFEFVPRDPVFVTYLSVFDGGSDVTPSQLTTSEGLVDQFKKKIAEFVVNPPALRRDAAPLTAGGPELPIEQLVDAAAAEAALLHQNQGTQIICTWRASLCHPKKDWRKRAAWVLKLKEEERHGTYLWRNFWKFLEELEKKTGLDVAEAFSDALLAMDQAYRTAYDAKAAPGSFPPSPRVLVSMHKATAAA